MNADRLRPAVLAFTAVALAAVLTACQEGGGTGAAADGTAASSPATSASASTPSGAAAATPSAGKGGGTSAATSGAKPAASVKPAAPAKPGASEAGCVDKAPTPDEVDPDEFAVYRVEELDGSTGKVNLVVQHGAWGCPGGDGDGVPFVVTGEDSRWALDQAAYVTATNPITDSSANQRIGVQELIDWIDAHPDSGLVFRYRTGADGSIDRLEQVYSP
ncbi:hypothetical protein [Streptomyces sp. H51]|uniref:hypothetical protein n=1 Tax=Streptomyces sp. H51 TaxID=3111770 RepID=UPI002D7853FA|nr:hypothetical protein [Streptomyces sp. H51]